MQWGTKSYESNSPIKFYLSFTNQYYAIALTTIYTGGARDEEVIIRVKSNNSCTYDTTQNRPVDWIAIGF